MKYRLPNGAILDGPQGLTRADLDRLAVERGLATPDVVQTWQAGGQQGKLQVGMVKGLSQAALQGLPLGTFSDELLAQAGYGQTTEDMLQPGSYERSLAQQAQEREAFWNQSPAASAAATLGGSALGGMGLVQAARSLFPKAVAAIGQIPAWASYPAGGAVTGGVTGAGAAEPGGRLQGAGLGAAGGATFGTILPMLGFGGRGVARGMGMRKGESTDILIKSMIADGASPDQIARRVAEISPVATMADVGDVQLSQAAKALRTPGRMRDERNAFVRQRSEGQAQRILAPIQRQIGGPDMRYETADQLRNLRETDGNKLYERAYAQPFSTTPQLQKMLDESTWIKQAWGQAQIAAKNLEASGEPQDYMMAPNIPSLRGWNLIKEQLDGMIGKEFGPEGTTTKGRNLMKVKNALLNELDKTNDIYANARQVWGSSLEFDNYMKLGEQFFNKPSGLTKQKFNSLTPAQKDAMTIGFMQSLENKLLSKPDSQDVTTIFNNESMRRKLKLFLPDDVYDEFQKVVKGEAQMERTHRALKNVPIVTKDQSPLAMAARSIATMPAHPVQGISGMAQALANATGPSPTFPANLATKVGNPLLTPLQMLDPRTLPYLQSRAAAPPLGPSLSLGGGLLGGNIGGNIAQ